MGDDMYVPYLSIGAAKVPQEEAKKKKIPLISYLSFQTFYH